MPADQPSFGEFAQLADDAEMQLRAIVEEQASATQPTPFRDGRRVGDFYRAFMDEPRIGVLGASPLLPELQRVSVVKHEGNVS